jgi:hypothetical protein
MRSPSERAVGMDITGGNEVSKKEIISLKRGENFHG